MGTPAQKIAATPPHAAAAPWWLFRAAITIRLATTDTAGPLISVMTFAAARRPGRTPRASTGELWVWVMRWLPIVAALRVHHRRRPQAARPERPRPLSRLASA